ncbi:MAG: MurR/RpiR family transcriptional regulator [Acidobacteriota bacterium]|nr:MurR/RpiR family transcriptional regulator [Acidobacteriota bacterium]
MSDVTPNVLGNIIAHMDDFSPAERRIAEFVLENQDAVIINQAELATTTETSAPTVSRFCKHVGAKNFREFQTLLYSDIMINHGDGISSHCREVSMDDVQGSMALMLRTKVDETEAFVNAFPPELMTEVVRTIKQSDRIFVAGIGKTIPCAIDAAYKLSLLGFHAETSEIYEKQLASALTLGPRDTILFISASGYCPRLLRVAKAAQDRGAGTIVITGNCTSRMAELADILIATTSRERALNSTFGFSITLYSFAIEMIYLLLASEEACARSLRDNSAYQIGKGLAMGD